MCERRGSLRRRAARHAREPPVLRGNGALAQAVASDAGGVAVRDPAPASAKTALRPAGLSKNEKSRRRDWIAEAEAAIADLEQEKAGLVAAMSSGDEEAEAIAGMGRRCQELDEAIAGHLAQWEQWSLELEGSGEEDS